MSEMNPLAGAHGAEHARPGDGLRIADAGFQGPRELVSPFTLLLLADSPGHGYALATRLRGFGFDWGGPGPLYNHLRELHRRGMVRSSLTPGEAGPVRRTYALTPVGYGALHAYAFSIRGLRHTLAQLVCECNAPLVDWTRAPAFEASAPQRTASTGLNSLAKARTHTEQANQRPSCEGLGQIRHPRQMVLAGILAIVARGPADSVGIIARLGDLGLTWDEPGPVLVHLHSLTSACLLSWRVPTGRPSRRGERVYELSPAGRLAMPAWIDSLHALYSMLTKWAQEYAKLEMPHERMRTSPL